MLAYGRIERTVELTALHEYLTHSYVAGDRTIIPGICRLPPASFLTVRNKHLERRSYWALCFQPSAGTAPEEEVLTRLGDLLEQCVSRRIRSDVPLGAFLSGGLDSSAVVALMARNVNHHY